MTKSSSQIHKWCYLWAMAVSACGFPRPGQQACAHGACLDPSRPFCDLGGEIAGTPQTCISVACTPGEFGACHGESALTCDGAGTSYEAIRCELGCDPAGGCRICEPDQRICANSTAEACNESGTATSSEACALGCLDDKPRCRELDPSNGLAPYMDMAATGPDLVLSSATLFLPLGRVTSPAGELRIQGEIVASPQDGVPIQVFPLRSLTVTGVLSIRHDSEFELDGPAVAFVVHGDVRIDGSIRLGASPGLPPPGAISTGPCVGAPGAEAYDQATFYASGGGGGGGATPGGAGGNQFIQGGPGGAAFSNPDLQPLRGGCAGGTPTGFTPGFGGGAIQITSRTSIHLTANSSIEANGLVGFAGTVSGPPGLEAIPGGGGAGGGILLEAPSVLLDAGVTLAANGGGGTGGDRVAATPASGRMPSFGGHCTSQQDPCSDGGNGGAISGPGGTAASIAYQGERQIFTGAGGGAIGTIRINSANGTYTKANDVFESPEPSTGTIATR